MFEIPGRARTDGLQTVSVAALRNGTAARPKHIIWTDSGYGKEAWAVDAPEPRLRRSDRTPEQGRLIPEITRIEEAMELAATLGVPFKHMIVRFR